jgi:transposase
LKVGWRFCEPADPQAKGAVERLQGYLETNFEARPVLRERALLPAPARCLV